VSPENGYTPSGGDVKLFSTKVHGVLDYGTVINLPILFRLLRGNGTTLRLADGGAVFVLIYSLLTRYELGAFRVLPMKGHFALDALLGAALCGHALGHPEERPAVRAALAGLGLFSLFASATTETEPSDLPPQ
jgi:hypothetical protein